MSINPKPAVAAATHPDGRQVDKCTALAACETTRPFGRHYKILCHFQEAVIQYPESIRLTSVGLCAIDIRYVRDLMRHDSDMITEAVAKRCLSWPVFAEKNGAGLKPLSTQSQGST